ncbi:hypothetical protein CDAR_576001 [Caerostris darwini]|uniref:Uncharacterized protein n=1 Tax=Caerostris darwini TaxID=1538125 RepID=A0AAV4XAC7_9ARAC|nr:hypothetical protein CDAR_576001 [Caerostris darwini]
MLTLLYLSKLHEYLWNGDIGINIQSTNCADIPPLMDRIQMQPASTWQCIHSHCHAALVLQAPESLLFIDYSSSSLADSSPTPPDPSCCSLAHCLGVLRRDQRRVPR